MRDFLFAKYDRIGHMNKEKILFIPGWMDKGEIHGYSNSLNIWTEKMKLNRRFEESVIIGHSAGAQMALLNWKKNKSSELILCGPMFPQKNFFGWLKKWIKFAFQEGSPMSRERLKVLAHPVIGFTVLLKMLKVDALKMIRDIPKNKITIIRGTKDIHFCDKEIANKLKREGYNIIEVEGAGHNWNDELANFLDKYLYEKN